MLAHSISDQLRLNALAFPQRTAIEVLGGPTLTYAESWARVTAIADRLGDVPAAGGLRLVGVLLPNGVDAALGLLGCQLAGCTAIPINNRLAPSEIEYVLDDSGLRVLLSADPFLSETATLAADRGIEMIDAATIETPSQPVAIDYEHRGGEPMLAAYTSGTTGFPKGGLYSHDGLYLQYLRWGWQFGLTGNQTVLTAGPMFHNSFGGLSLLALMAGATNRVMRAFEAAGVMEELRENATFAMLVPSMIGSVLELWRDQDRAPLPSIRFLLSSGAPITASLLSDSLEAFPNAVIAEAYGWSEGGWVTYEEKRPETLVPQCVGAPMPGAEVVMLDEEGRLCGVGERGEIAVELAVNPFLGYLNRPDAAAETMVEGRLLSGDIGIPTEDGRILLVDRKKDMIVTGGENVYSVEVERALLDHPGISEAAVVGRAHEHWGEAVTAVVVSNDAGLDEDDVREFCRRQLAGYKVPKRVEFTEALPRNAMGKIQKFLLREPAREEAR